MPAIAARADEESEIAVPVGIVSFDFTSSGPLQPATIASNSAGIRVRFLIAEVILDEKSWRRLIILEIATDAERERARAGIGIVVGTEIDVRCAVAVHIGIVASVFREVVQIVTRHVELGVRQSARGEQPGGKPPAQRDLLNPEIGSILDETVGNF